MIEQIIIQSVNEELNLERWFEMGGKGSGHWRHRGRKGKRGGSAPSKGMAGKKLSAPMGELKTYEDMQARIRANKGNVELGNLINDFEGMNPWMHANEEERSNLKAKVARDLAAASGVTEQEASDFVQQWAHSSNDNDMRSLAVQQDAAKEFGVELSDFTKEKIRATNAETERRQKSAQKFVSDLSEEQLSKHYPGKTRQQVAKDVAAQTWHKGAPLMESNKQRAVLRSMYNETQAELKSRGITKVRLSRGVKLPRDEGLKTGDTISLQTNSLESWSISEDVANQFASSGYLAMGVTFEAVVPAERILSIPATGFGCLTEGEVVMLGGVDGDIAEVKGVYYD